MSRDWLLYIEDITNSCQKIQRYTHGLSLKDFQHDEKTFDAVVRNLEIIGEAAKQLPDTITALLPEVEWRKVAGLRDIIAHAYFGIDVELLWDIIQHKIPELLDAISNCPDLKL